MGGGNDVGKGMKSSEEVIQIVGRGMVEIGNMWGWGVVKMVSEILPRGVNDWYTWGRKEGEMVRPLANRSSSEGTTSWCDERAISGTTES
jgi:hypothetical protein